MSSTTSSDCECGECSQCSYSFENNHNIYGQCMANSHHVPMYTTMAHPLIYYAQVQPLYKRQYHDPPRRENPFKKAFNWYTRERTIFGQKDVAPERCGFAIWLDNKYSEYLRENGQQPQGARTSINNTCECPKPVNQKRRFKSPWRKRTCPAGDVPQSQKCVDGSCQYILKPKDLSRAASDNCYHSPTSGDKSNDTMDSSHMPCNARNSRRSQSLDEVSCEKYVHKHVETNCTCAQEQKVYAPLKKGGQDCECPEEKVPEAVQVPSKQQDSRNQPKPPCTCQKENLPVPPCTCQKKKVPEPVKVPSKTPSNNQPKAPCTCQQKKKTEVVKVPSKAQDSGGQPVAPCTCSQERVSVVEKLPSKPKEPFNYSQEEIAVVVIVPSKVQDSTKQAVVPRKPSQETVPVVEKLPSKVQEPTIEPIPELKKVPEAVSVAPSKSQEPSFERHPCCKCNKEKLQKVVQVPSKDQDTKDQPSYCCSCHVKKVPEVVQVPSQCRAVEESCQCPQIKVVPVCEGTQYEPAPELLRTTQNLVTGPCCCKICKTPIPPPAPLALQPPIFCIPVQVQSNKTSGPDICLKVAPSAQCVSPKKPKKVKQINIASQCGEGSKSKVDSQCQQQSDPSETRMQCQYETCVCRKNKPSSNNCHEVSQVFGPIPIKRESHSTVAVNQQTGEYSITKEVAVVNKFTRCVTCASNDAAQTSDHSIRFEKDGACCPYPLYFKIVSADVVKN